MLGTESLGDGAGLRRLVVVRIVELPMVNVRTGRELLGGISATT